MAAAFTLTPEQIRRAERIVAEGGTQDDLAEAFSTTSRTIRRHLDRDRNFREAVARGRAARDLPVMRETLDVAELAPVDHEIAFRGASQGLQPRSIAREVGVTWESFRAALDADPTLRDALEDGLAALKDEALSILRARARESASAAIALNEMLGRTRNPSPPPETRVNVVFNLPAALSPEQWAETIDVTPRGEAMSGPTTDAKGRDGRE